MTDESPFTQRDAANLQQALRDLTDELRETRKEFASTYARKDVIEPQLATIRRDVDTHSKWFTWVVSLVLSTVILAVLGLVIFQGGGPPL